MRPVINENKQQNNANNFKIGKNLQFAPIVFSSLKIINTNRTEHKNAKYLIKISQRASITQHETAPIKVVSTVIREYTGKQIFNYYPLERQ